MVLKFLAIVIAVSQAWAAPVSDPPAYTKAAELAQKNHNEAALRVLETNFNLHSRELPLKVSVLATSLLVQVKRWHKAEQVADGALNAAWPGWMTKKPARPSAEFYQLVKFSAQAKAEILEAGDEPRDHARLVSEIKTYSDVLTANSADAETARSLAAKVETHAVVQKAAEFHYAFAVLASYWTWEDRPTFDYHLAGKAKVFTPCFGLSVDYTNDFLHWSLGACYGAGTASLQFNNSANTYDNRAKVTLISGLGSVLVNLSKLGSGVGIEGAVMNVTTSGMSDATTRSSATNQEFAVTAVGRYRVGSIDFKFKGGPVISTPSALWAFEMAYVF